MAAPAMLITILPICILCMLLPVLEASTYSNAVKGSFIGLYCGISLIGLMRLREELR